MFFRTIVIIMKKKTSPQQNFIVMKGKKKVKQVMKLDANKVLKKNQLIKTKDEGSNDNRCQFFQYSVSYIGQCFTQGLPNSQYMNPKS